MTIAGAPVFDLEHLHQKFTRLYDDYRLPIRNYLSRMLQRPDVAEDLTQDVFVKAWTALPRFRDEHPSAWIYRIANRVGLDYYRWRRIRWGPDWAAFVVTDHPGLVAPDDPEGDALAAERRRHVAACLARLRPREAAALVRYEYDTRSYAAAAARLGMSVPAFKALLYRARAAFALHWRDVTGEVLPLHRPVRTLSHRCVVPGVYFREFRTAEGRRRRPWIAAPYDPERKHTVHLGCFATEAEARAALAEWRTQQQQLAQGAAA